MTSDSGNLPADDRLVTAEEMRGIERACGIPTLTLMEAAGRAVAEAARSLASESGRPGGPVLVLAGKGNNGGDGYAAAAELKAKGVPVTVLALASVATLTGDAAASAQRARSAGVAITEATTAEAVQQRFSPLLAQAAIVIDAILGTGTRAGTADAILVTIAKMMAESSLRVRPGGGPRVLAVDLPSGIVADTGQALRGAGDAPCAVRADRTLTLGRAKPGLFLWPGATYAGEVRTCSIGIRDEAFAATRGMLVTPRLGGTLLPRRAPLAHKGAARVLVLGGASGMRGAASLAAAAALRAGAGYVFLSTPSTTPEIPEPVEAVRRPLPGTPDGRFAPEAAAAAGTTTNGMHAVVLGSGLGRGNAEQRLAEVCTRSLHMPTVVDADALAQIAPDSAAMSAGKRVLTPHPGEFAQLFGGTVATNEEDRVGRAVRAAAVCGQVVVFKGRPTVTADPDGRYFINATGNELLATCGSGDVLAGIIGALLAQGLAPREAGAAAAAVHGRTAELWPHAVGMTAGDIARGIPEAWTRMLEAADRWPRRDSGE